MKAQYEMDQRECVLRGVFALFSIGLMLTILILAWPRLFGFELGATVFLTGAVVWRLLCAAVNEFRRALRLEIERQGGLD